MKVLLSLAVFLTLTGVLILVRFRWPLSSARARSWMIAIACVVPLVGGTCAAMSWSTVYPWLNAVVYTGVLVSYEFFVILFTRLRPRWLTTTIGVILIVPLLSASVFLPMSDLLRKPTVTVDLGSRFLSEVLPWGTGGPQTSGTDLTIFYRPAWLPFMQKSLLSSRYYGGQCNAWAAYAVLQPNHRSALMVCPPWPGPTAAPVHYGVWSFK
jgi:hypothetical protein